MVISTVVCGRAPAQRIAIATITLPEATAAPRGRGAVLALLLSSSPPPLHAWTRRRRRARGRGARPPRSMMILRSFRLLSFSWALSCGLLLAAAIDRVKYAIDYDIFPLTTTRMRLTWTLTGQPYRPRSHAFQVGIPRSEKHDLYCSTLRARASACRGPATSR